MEENQPLLYTPEGLRGSRKAEVLAELIFRFLQHDLSALQYYDFDHVHSSYLPHLIRQFALEEFADFVSLGDSGVRELLKNAVELHRYRGTPWAFDKIFDLVGAEVELIEWWQLTPKGEPYTARVVFWGDDNPALDFSSENWVSRLSNLLRVVSPAARYIELNIGYQIGADPNTGAGALAIAGASSPCPIVEVPGQPLEFTPSANVQAASAPTVVSLVEIPGDSIDSFPSISTSLESVLIPLPFVSV